MRSSVLRFVQRLFLGIGFAALTYAGAAAVYAEIYQRYQSWKFEEKLDMAEFAKPGVIVVPEREGDPVGKLEIPRIGISVMVFEGVEPAILRIAAGHIPGTPSPGAGGNTAIAAHRDTFFRKLQGIRSDDRIQMSTLRGTYEYTVHSTEIVDPQDTEVLESRGFPELTLITCYPFYFVGSAPKRFIVHARPANPVED